MGSLPPAEPRSSGSQLAPVELGSPTLDFAFCQDSITLRPVWPYDGSRRPGTLPGLSQHSCRRATHFLGGNWVTQSPQTHPEPRPTS